jgi:hypothetical protein
MDRRRFLLTSLAGALAAPLGAGAQAGKVHRIGVLLPLGVTPPILASFLAGMRDRGWVENRASSPSLAMPKASSNSCLSSPLRWCGST